ncbi:4'-phosphopantetheinyl transferase family protein [Oceaniglobus roseus]|uniref:4'-phosphopantetheinyl transferase family protein n=1 Tax=Oceaniglobus roseus TaxID=1737570 RepID=UPI000C7F0791|nr:hypothetical protein [Kandeliimicrobium roseum]
MSAGPVAAELCIRSLDDGAEDDRALLSAAERDRADRFLHPRDRLHFTAARAGLRRRLAGHIGVHPAALPLRTAPNGKPELPGGPIFNLSHAAGLAALAVTPAADVWRLHDFRPAPELAGAIAVMSRGRDIAVTPRR